MEAASVPKGGFVVLDIFSMRISKGIVVLLH